MQQSLGAFVLICTLLTITPGADTALILNRSLKVNAAAVFATNLGICAGLVFHATMSALGLSAILTQSSELYSAVKLLGAAYLSYLGLKSLYEAFWVKAISADNKSKSESADPFSIAKPDVGSNERAAIRAETFAASFRVGLLTNVLNPKVAIFYLTFLPQFVNPASNVFFQSTLLGLIHVGLSFVWLALISRFVSTFKTALMRPSVKRKLEAVTGLALLGFGIKLAFSER